MRFNWFLVGVLQVVGASAWAADWCVRAGASGAGSGADWANALTALPATLRRGDTYYVADGTYPGYEFDDAVSGTTPITIRKATASAHGSGVGWDDTYGDGQAAFTSQVSFTTSYWVFDGQSGGGPPAFGGGATSWKTGLGFKVSESASEPVIFINGGGHVTVSHVEIAGAGNNGTGGSRGNDSFQVLGGSGPVFVSHAYAHDVGRCHFYHGGGPNSPLTVSHSYFGQYESTSGEHSEFAILRSSALFTLRWSVVTHEEGTGGIIAGDNGPTTAEIYGNIFYDSGEFGGWGGGNNGLIGAFTLGSAATNWKVYDNTFVDLPSDLSVFGIPGQNPSGNRALNNYFFNTANHNEGSGWTQSHNHYQDSGAATGALATTGTGNPFVDSLQYDFRLRAPPESGMSLPAPYDRDLYGNQRGTGGGWTRGAIQFHRAPRGPDGLRVTPP